MHVLVHLPNPCNPIPPARRQVNFHTTLSGDAMVTLLYHRKLDAEWTAAAQRLRCALRDGAPSLQPAGRLPQASDRAGGGGRAARL